MNLGGGCANEALVFEVGGAGGWQNRAGLISPRGIPRSAKGYSDGLDVPLPRRVPLRCRMH